MMIVDDDVFLFLLLLHLSFFFFREFVPISACGFKRLFNTCDRDKE